MSIRAHFTTANSLNMSLFVGSDAPDKYGEEDNTFSHRLVIEDAGNLEAFVIDGNLTDIQRLAIDILTVTTRRYAT